MTDPLRNTWRARIGAIVLAFTIGLGVGLVLTDSAAAHTARPAACTVAWQKAPAGQKWAAKQRCIAAQQRHNCVTHPRPVPRSVRVKGARVNNTYQQRYVVGWVVNEGLRRKLPRKVVLTALVAGTQESELRELPYGDWTSVGPWQLTHYHGPEHLRVTVEYSGNWFFNHALREVRRNPRIAVHHLAQKVEVSGHPDLYEQWIPESKRTLAAVLGPCRLR